MGQRFLSMTHCLIQSLWNSWPHSKVPRSSPSAYSSCQNSTKKNSSTSVRDLSRDTLSRDPEETKFSKSQKAPKQQTNSGPTYLICSILFHSTCKRNNKKPLFLSFMLTKCNCRVRNGLLAKLSIQMHD